MRRIVCFFILLLSVLFVNGQQVTTTAGNSGSGVGISLDWTIGETLSETLLGSTAHLTQGLHQGKLVITSINDKPENTLISVFPNPVSCLLNVNFGKENCLDGQLLLFDVYGKLVIRKSVSRTVETIDLEALQSGTYLLHILSVEQQALKMLKVLKK